MQILLERTGGQISALQGALANLISVNYQDGYAQGYLNNFNIFVSASNAVSVDTGLIQVRGFRMQNDELHTETIAVLPSAPTEYQLIVILDVRKDAENSTCVFGLQPATELTQENVFETGEGTYEFQIARFTAAPSGITDFKVTIKHLDITDADISEIKAIAEEAKNIAQSVRDDADAGKFDGKDGKDGAPGAPMVPSHIYSSVEAMNADIDNPAVEQNDFAVIQSPKASKDADNAKVYMATVDGGEKQWLFIADMSGLDGITSAAGMCPVAITLGMWTGSARPYSLTITYSKDAAPGTQNIGRTRFLMVGFLPDESENSASGGHCNYTIDDNGTITVSSNAKWEGTVTVAGGVSEGSNVKGIGGEMTLPASAWADNHITFTVEDMNTDDAVLIAPTSAADKSGMESLEIFPTSSGNQITFAATSMPGADISINYFILRGAESE